MYHLATFRKGTICIVTCPDKSEHIFVCMRDALDFIAERKS